MVLVSVSFFEMFAWRSDNMLMNLGAVETSWRVLDFTSWPGGPQVVGERTQNRGEALCWGVAKGILWPAG